MQVAEAAHVDGKQRFRLPDPLLCNIQALLNGHPSGTDVQMEQRLRMVKVTGHDAFEAARIDLEAVEAVRNVSLIEANIQTSELFLAPNRVDEYPEALSIQQIR